MSRDGNAARTAVDGPGFQETGVPARGIVKVGAGLIGLILVSMAVVAGILAFMPNIGGRPPAQGVAAVPLAPPTPRLEVDPRGDRAAIESAGRNRIESYSWTDKSHRHARIPVERAMDILAARGWPDPREPAP